MNKKFIAIAIALMAFTSPLLAGAHERQLINIGGTDYLFVVGSLGEPVVVDDKTGVDFRVMTPDPKDPTNASAAGVKPVTGLEQALKVEISAGEKKKTFDLTTVYGSVGSYKAVFFPTVKTGLTYRFTGTINNTLVDLSFTCAPEGSKAVEDKSSTELGEGIVRTYKNGQFGCPMGKEELGFPEEGMTTLGLHEELHGEMEAAVAAVNSRAGAGIAFGIIALVLGVVALRKSRKSI